MHSPTGGISQWYFYRVLVVMADGAGTRHGRVGIERAIVVGHCVSITEGRVIPAARLRAAAAAPPRLVQDHLNLIVSATRRRGKNLLPARVVNPCVIRGVSDRAERVVRESHREGTPEGRVVRGAGVIHAHRVRIDGVDGRPGRARGSAGPDRTMLATAAYVLIDILLYYLNLISRCCPPAGPLHAAETAAESQQCQQCQGQDQQPQQP